MNSHLWILQYLMSMEFFLDTLLTLVFTFVVFPLLAVCYLVTQFSRRSLIKYVKWRSPEHTTVVERSSIRGILDNGKNQGVYALLVQGKTIHEGLSLHLNRLIQAKRSLRSTLTSKCGFYVWKYVDDFSLKNVLIEAPMYFRGRAISEVNIQEYVSEVTSKFLPANQPPWQVHTISYTVKGEKIKLCLVRAHHLLLHQENLTLGDFLPLKYLDTSGWSGQNADSPFANVYTKPSALPTLYQKLTESFSNYWNEFLCNNDPTERPDILKTHIGLFLCLKILVITVVSSFKQLRDKSSLRPVEIMRVLECEAGKRSLCSRTVTTALLKHLDPIQYFYLGLELIQSIIGLLTVKIPMFLAREVRALLSKNKHYHPDTFTSWLTLYLPLMANSLVELVTIVVIVLGIWRSILYLCFAKNSQGNKLQSVSSCGRKVVAWSQHVDVELLENIGHVTGASHAEILLAATVDSLKVYFSQIQQEVPAQVLVTAKHVSQRALYVHNHTSAEALLCLELPTKTPLFHDDLLEILQITQRNLDHSRSKQRAVYTLMSIENSTGIISACLPSVILKIILNYLTRRYSISINHVDNDLPIDDVDMAVYWSPPQGNCNMTITLHRHGTGVRLAVMADAVLSPEHAIITKVFPNCLKHLAATLGVPLAPSSNSQSLAINPTTSPGY